MSTGNNIESEFRRLNEKNEWSALFQVFHGLILTFLLLNNKKKTEGETKLALRTPKTYAVLENFPVVSHKASQLNDQQLSN